MTAALKKISLQTILLSGLLVGTLDILSAFVDVYLSSGKNPLIVLNYIARGAFGKSDFAASDGGAAMGLLFHYIIAFSFTVLFFFLYTRFDWMRTNWVLTGILYGLFIWCVMNLGVVRLSKIPTGPISAMQPLKVLKAALILICMIGLPLAYIANKSVDGANEKGKV
ncbi:hypothetical protein [Ferruginibacter sp.]